MLSLSSSIKKLLDLSRRVLEVISTPPWRTYVSLEYKRLFHFGLEKRFPSTNYSGVE